MSKLFFGFMFYGLMGCAKQSQKPSISKIQFEGNGKPWSSTSDYGLKTAIQTKENQSFSFIQSESRRSHLNVEEIQLDAWRIEAWYANQGYVDSRFLGWEITAVQPIFFGLLRNNQVVVTGRLSEGEPVPIRQLKLDGITNSLLRSKAKTFIYQSEGDPLSMDYLSTSRDAITYMLLEAGYSRSHTDLKVNIWPANCEELALEHRVSCQKTSMLIACEKKKSCKVTEEDVQDCIDLDCLESRGLPSYVRSKSKLADVFYTVNTGSINTIGTVTIDSDIETNIDRFLDGVPLEEGERYAPSKLVGAQRYLYSLGIFSVVNVVADMSSDDSALPVHITLKENLPRQAKVGAGISLESGMQEVHVSTGFLHRNLFQYVVRSDTNAQIGYAVVPDPDTTVIDIIDISDTEDVSLEDKFENKAPVALVNTRFEVPRILDSLWSVQFEAQYEEGLEPTFRFRSPEVSPSVSYPFSIQKWGINGLDFQFGYHYIYFKYLSSAIDFDLIENSRLGLDNQEQYSLSYLSQRISIDGRDNPINPTDGWYLTINFSEAGKFLGGAYDYWRTTEELRVYYPLISLSNWKPFGSDKSIRRRRLEKDKVIVNPKGVIAFRGVTGFIFPYLDGVDGLSPAPYAEHIFLGGSSNVRGWGKNRLGPYICDNCIDDNGVQIDSDVVPIGGTATLWGSIEFRRYSDDGYGIVLFNDWGMLWGLPEEYSLRGLSPSVGVGGRYRSPIGALRLDVARNLNQENRFALEDRWTIHFSLAEAF